MPEGENKVVFMPEPIRKIDLAPIRRLALKEFKHARHRIQKEPGHELTPTMLVVTGDIFDETKWKYTILVFADFAEGRNKMLAGLAAKFAQDDEHLVAIILTSETWVSKIPYAALRQAQGAVGELVEPRFDPNHTEELMVQAMTLDLQEVYVSAGFKRNATGKAIFEQTEIHQTGDLDKRHKNYILMNFIQAYAVAVMEKLHPGAI